MKLKYIVIFKIFFILFLNNSFYSQSYTIRGYVFDESNGEKLIGANIYIEELNIGAATDINGSFTLENLQADTYTIRYSYLAYLTHKDTITLSGEDKNVSVEVYLKRYNATIIRKPEIEEYHLRLDKLASKNNLLKINVDSLEKQEGKIIVYSTFTNLSLEPIYIIKERPCFRVIKPQVFRKNTFIKNNAVSLDCDVMPYGLINNSDLIIIEPYKSISYPATELFLYSFNYLPKGEYQIGIKYTFGGPSSLGGIFGKPEDDAILIALRGEYISENFLLFINQ